MGNKKYFLICVLMVCCFTGSIFSEKIKYFKLDKIVTVSGEILKIRTDTKEHKSDFIIFELKSKKNEFYTVEVSPKWFYKIDIVNGNFIEVKGSLNIVNKKNIILTQSITQQGEIYYFRDKFGFPLWRGKREGLNNKNINRKRKRKGKF